MKALRYVLAAAIVFAVAGEAAAVDITNCTAAPVQKVGKKTVLNLPNDDVVIKCALSTLVGTDKVQVIAKSITVDGSAPDSGSVAAGGKGLAIELIATNGGIIVDDASVIASNANGELKMLATGNILVTAGSHLMSGDADQMKLTCTGADCTITINGTTVDGNQIFVTAQGTIVIAPTTVIKTTCPRDLIVITSNTGNVVVSGSQLGLGTACCQQALATCANPNDPQCPFSQQGGQICLNTKDQLDAFCQPECGQQPSNFNQCVEGNIIISAVNGFIDVSGTTMHAGESITFTAKTTINMASATIDNCGKKSGVFTVTSLTNDTCDVSNAVLKDDAPETQPTLNCSVFGVATELGTCPATP